MSVWMFLRVDFTPTMGIGPHWANMLEAIDRFGSLSAAAPAAYVTYRVLWQVVQRMNSTFDEPLIGIRRSGRNSGAFLTPLGKQVLAQFRKIQRVADEALAPHFRELEKLGGLDPQCPTADTALGPNRRSEHHCEAEEAKEEADHAA